MLCTNPMFAQTPAYCRTTEFISFSNKSDPICCTEWISFPYSRYRMCSPHLFPPARCQSLSLWHVEGFLWIFLEMFRNISVCDCPVLPTASHSRQRVEGWPPESLWPTDEGPCHVLGSGPPPGQWYAGVRLAHRHAGRGAHWQGHCSTGVCLSVV